MATPSTASATAGHPDDNGDFAWMQHIAKSLKPAGRAIVVMSQGILFRGQPKLTEEEDGRNKKADDEYLIRSVCPPR